MAWHRHHLKSLLLPYRYFIPLPSRATPALLPYVSSQISAQLVATVPSAATGRPRHSSVVALTNIERARSKQARRGVAILPYPAKRLSLTLVPAWCPTHHPTRISSPRRPTSSVDRGYLGWAIHFDDLEKVWISKAFLNLSGSMSIALGG